jgi:integrase
VTEAGRQWVEACEATGLERTTIDGYRQHLKLHIEPLLGGLKLAQLSAPLIRQFEELREA